MSSTTSKFSELMTRAKNGEQLAIEELVNRYEPEVRMVARVRLGKALRPYLDSADLMQSVHRSLMIGLRDDKFDISSPQKLIGLAMTIVRRKIAKHWRKLRRQQRGSWNQRSGNLSAIMVGLSNYDGDPEADADLRDQLENLLSRLDETERQLIELRFEGYTTAEVANMMGADADVLRVKLSRLRRRIRDLGMLADWV